LIIHLNDEATVRSPREIHEEIRVQTLTLQEALAATRQDYRCDPEAALALWLYAGSRFSNGCKNTPE
jgi:hypothetical protein